MSNGRVDSIVNSTFEFLSSLRLAITLIILLAIFSIVGTVVVQTPLAEPGQIERNYMPATIKLFTILGFFDAYHSKWFGGLLLLLSLNLIFCTIDLFPRHWPYVKNPSTNASEYFVKAQTFNGGFKTSLADHELKEKVLQVFKKHSLKAIDSKFPDREVFFAQRGLWWRFTVYFIHASLLVIFTGGLIGWRVGFDGFLRVAEGMKTSEFFRGKTIESLKTYPLGFELKCDHARFVFRDDLPGFAFDSLNPEHVKSVGLVKSWFSDVTISQNGNGTFSRTIKVNDPLDYNGLKIYQASFGITADFKKLAVAYKKKDAPDSEAKAVTLVGREPVKVPGTNFSLRVAQFIPDLVISKQTQQPASRSGKFFDPTYSNPAIRLEIIKDDGSRLDAWSFLNFPWLDKREKLDYAFTIQQIEPKYYTGLSVNHAPEVPIVYTGFFMLALSLILRFYFAHKRYWVLLQRDGKYHSVLVGGHTSRHKFSFEKQFNAFFSDLKAEVEA